MGLYRLGSYGGMRPLGNWGNRGGPRSSRSCRAASSAASNASGSYFQRVKGLNGPWNAACTSGVLSAMGDTLAQFMAAYLDQKQDKPAQPYNPLRTLRMFGFGFCWYGPFQYYWYNLLDFSMPVKNTANFLCKVASNQLLLAPCTLTAVFAWNLALMDKAAEIPNKLKQDLLPTMMNGWKFWIPAASVNFYCVPVHMQVMYMSCCGVLWTAYLSYASTTPQVATAKQLTAGPEVAEKKGDKKGKKSKQ